MLVYLLLGIVQGLTEFIPVSSSGHLVIAKTLFGLTEPDATIEIFLHAGTLLSILVFYRKKIVSMLASVVRFRRNEPDFRLSMTIIIASVPAGLIGVLFNDAIERMFGDAHIVAAMLIITGLLLISSRFSRARQDYGFTINAAILIGLAQAIAIMPGISRSGATIVCALWLGAKSEDAAQFSFLLALPAMFGAILLKAKDIISTHAQIDPALVIASGVAFAVGLASLYVLLPVLRRGKLWVFGAYCALAGILSLVFV
jgi:undecaprenyl-diphosphatase